MRILLAPVVSFALAQEAQLISKKYMDAESVYSALRAGELGGPLAEAANRDGKPNLRKFQTPGVPFDFYVIEGSRGIAYTVMVENDHLVLLCSAFGGGYATDIALVQDGPKKALTFFYTAGSGITRVYDCKYLLGSGVVSSKERPWQP
ncbi:MAG TPA: hypothetical protein VJ505_05660 [Holophagaceae bacterium]|nr:hypothetical protein [Holophagaceae bacterium]